MARPFIKINGREMPCPSRGLVYEGQQLVDSAKNANGVMVGATINRRQLKLSNLYWGILQADEWEFILNEVMGFTASVEFYSPHNKAWVRMVGYFGNDSSEIFHLDEDNKPRMYRNCSCNIIDVGVPLEVLE